ncbi:MAG: cytochrome c-type biosis protein CcmF [Solirubrobacteraceae bacterium]|nr:cytochrome c-type biosis protein CcmF [Solirubrobacteraceae bacterium]
MATVGRACLILALAMCAYGIVASIYGARARRPDWAESGRRSVYAVAVLTSVSFAILEIAFLRSDFSFAVVSSHSSTTTPFFYRLAASWSSQEGSLLLWMWLLSMWASLVLFLTRRRLRDVAPYATAVLLGFGAFFGGLLVFAASPFGVLAVAPQEGVGLNPLLRHPSMMIHPPMLYSGYTLFAVPFAFAVGALIVRRVDAEWISATRRFALAAWFFLGVGILLGARWSYSELGWGGYWAWDPVENASLLPWLTGTAFIHSLMIQEKRGMLKVWNASLILATGTLAVLGTFLVRSGILDSIHAFGASTLGIPFVTLIGLMIAGSMALVVSRRDTLRSDQSIDSLLSREAIFLFNNLVLVAMAFVVFFWTFLPLITEALGNKVSVGPPVYNQYIVPLALMLVLLSGIGPVAAWRRTTLKTVRRNFIWPIGAALATFFGLIAAGVTQSIPAVLMFAFAALVIAVVAQEFVRGASARRAMAGGNPVSATFTLVGRNRRRYGGYIVHVGMALLFVGVAASSAFQHAHDVTLREGQTTKVGDYTIRYVKPTSNIATLGGDLEKISFGAVLDVSKNGKHLTTLRPSKAYFPSQDQSSLGPIGRFFEGDATSEVGMKAGLRRDLWTAMSPDISRMRPIIDKGDKAFAAIEGKVPPKTQAIFLGQAINGLVQRYRTQPPPASFRMISSPLVAWIWIGGLVVFTGGLIALWPSGDPARGRVRGRYAARVARDLGRA